MSIQIGTFIKTPLLKVWTSEFISKMFGFVECQHFPTIVSLTATLKNKDELKLSKYYIMIDIEDELHVEYISQIKKVAQKAKFIALGLPKHTDQIKNIFKVGYNGYIDIAISTTDFINAMNTLQTNQYFLPSNLIDELIDATIKDSIDQNNPKNSAGIILKEKLTDIQLTNKEIEVIDYLLKGFSFKQISQIIGVTSFAVNQRTKSVYKKCNVKSRNELSYLLLK